jgi:hypothetical protein
MRKISFILFFVLILPLPIGHSIIEGMIPESNNVTEPVYTISLDDLEIEIFSQSIQIIPSSNNQEQSDSSSPNPLHLLIPATYMSYSSLIGNSSLVQKGDAVQLTAGTEFELIGRFPVDRGDHHWYDLVTTLDDNQPSTGTFSDTKIAVAFTLPVSIDYMAFSFNISQVLASMSSSQLDFYLAENLNDFQTNYLMKSEISVHTFNFHKNNPSSPLMFIYRDHPLSTEVNPSLIAGNTYYAILSSTGDFSLQYSDDASGIDANNVYLYNGGLWTEQTAVDIQFAVYQGSQIQTSAVDSSGESLLIYDSSISVDRLHRISSSYFDSSNTYDSSSDYWDLDIIDSIIPEFLTLTCPPTAEYSDTIDLVAKVENLYHQSLENQNVSFYASENNSTWLLIDDALTNSNGFATVEYLITEASGTVYFKAVSNLLTSYAETLREKETVVISVPEVNTIYGNKINSANLATYELSAQLLDNDNSPLVAVVVVFYMSGSLDPIFVMTDATGTATTSTGFIDWNAGYYPNSFWISVSLDSDLYDYTSTIYGDISIAPNNITLETTTSLNNYWNDPLNVSIGFLDGEDDYLPNINYELLIYSESTGINTSLGIFSTDQYGYGNHYFASEFFDPGEYVLYVRVSSINYYNFEQAISLSVTEDQANISVNLQYNENYEYNSNFEIEVYVTDHLGQPLENITVKIFISLPNYFDFWFDHIYLTTDETGYASCTIILNLEAGEELNIMLTTEDFSEDGIVYYLAAVPHITYVTCIPASSSFVQLVDINCVNQETISITGQLVSGSNGIANETLTITILGQQYIVVTDMNGYFVLEYFVPSGGNIAVDFLFDSSTNYISSNASINLVCASCDLIITTADIHQETSQSVTFVVHVESIYGTYPGGLTVIFSWYDGQSWIFINTAVTNSSGYAILSPSMSFPLGEWLWKAEVQSSVDWSSATSVSNLKIGFFTATNIVTSGTVEFSEYLEVLVYVQDEYSNPLEVEVSFYLDGIFIGSATSNSSGIASLVWLVDFVPQTYTLTAVIDQFGMYLDSSDDTSLTITKTESYISSDDVFIYYNESAEVQIYLFSSLGALSSEYLTLNISGVLTDQIITNSSGWGVWVIPSIQPGIYSLIITFEGNSYFLASSLSITLQINKMPTDILLNASSQDYTPNYQISGYIQDLFMQPIEGLDVILRINGSVYQIVTSEVTGYYLFIVSLQPGTYIIEISFEGNQDYLSSSTSKTVYIWKIDTSVQGTINWVDTTLTMQAYLEDSANQPIEGAIVWFYLNGSYVGQNITDSSGHTLLEVTGVAPGVYEIVIMFEGTSIFEGSSQLIVLEQSKAQTEISVLITEGIYAITSTTAEIHLTSEGAPLEGKLIMLTIDGVQYFGLTNATGYVLITLDILLEAGLYNMELDFSGDVLYSAVSFNQLVYVAKAETSIELSFYYDNYQPMLGGVLNSILSLSGEQIHIYINGTYLKSLSIDALGEFLTSLGLAPGLYNILVKFDGNRNNLGSEKTLEVNISKTPTQLSGNVDVYHEYGEESSFIVLLTDTLSNPIQANLIITIDGNYFATVSTNSSGYAVITLTSDIIVDNHEIIIEFQGDSTFYQSSLSVNLTVKYPIELVSIEFDAASYGEEGYISGMIESFSGLLDQVTITMYLDGSPLQTLTDSTGYFLFTISQSLDSGIYTIILRIDESAEIFFFEYQFMIEREKASYDVSLTAQTVVYNAGSSITGYVTVLGAISQNTELEVFIDGVLLGNLYTDSLGNFIIPAQWLSYYPGEYNLTTIVLGAGINIQDTQKEFSFIVHKDSIEVTIYYASNVVEDQLQLQVYIKNSQGEALELFYFTININGIDYLSVTDELGRGLIYYDLSAAGDLIIHFTSSSTVIYNYKEETFSIEVQKCASLITIPTNFTYYDSTMGLKVVLTSVNGNPIVNAQVLILIDSQEILVTTNSHGIFYLDLSSYEIGQYSINFQFEGSDDYIKLFLTEVISIKKQQTQIKVENTESELIIILLDGENRSLANKEIEIQFIRENGTVIWKEKRVTDNLGKIVINKLEMNLTDDVFELKFVFEEETYYEFVERTISETWWFIIEKGDWSLISIILLIFAIPVVVGSVILRKFSKNKRQK